MENVIELPIVDFKRVLSDGEARKSESNKLVDAFSNVGFCLVTNLPEYDESEVFEAIR